MSITFVTIDGIVRPISGNRKIKRNATTLLSVKQPKGFKSNSKQYSSDKAFTVPNAKCPNCGDNVFYYEHPNGAKVYFDELGPPWPKHPCIIERRTSTKRKVSKNKPASANWMSSYWKPLILEKKVKLANGEGVRVQAKTSEYSVRFLLKNQLLKQKFCSGDDIDQLIMLARKTEDKIRPKVEIALTSGLQSWTMLGELVTQVNEPKVSQTTTVQDKKTFDPLGKSKIPFSLNIEDKRVHVSLLYDGQDIQFIRSSKKAANKWLLKGCEHLDAWVEETKKKRHFRVYVVDPQTGDHIEQLFRKSENRDQESPVEQLEFISLSKLPEGKVKLEFKVPKKKSRLNATFDIQNLVRCISLEQLLTSESKVEVESLNNHKKIISFNGIRYYGKDINIDLLDSSEY
ncbi:MULTISPECIES: hypothetical protein [Vibrio]|uniref:hypothetical protein n=3 Tax=Vibrionaceae TaxID=641 RepID=UPI00352CFCEA